MRALMVRAALALAILGGVLTRIAAAAAACADLPPSTLHVYDIKMPALEEVEMPAAALNRIDPGTALGSRHTLMFTTADVVTLFEIQHRLVPQADGSVCDAPKLVRIGLGAGRRVAYLARAAASNSCVRQKMLAHAEDHNRRFNATVDRFIAQRNQDLQTAVTALKQMPAPNADLAKARWETGLRSLLDAATGELRRQIRADNAALDDGPTLAELADACGGIIRRLLGTEGL